MAKKTRQNWLCGSCKKPKGSSGKWFCNCWRPEKYKHDYIARVDEYLAQCRDEETTFQKLYWKMNGFDRIIKVNLPSVEGFALYIKVPVSTLYLRRSKYPLFLEALDRIVVTQRERLINNGLSNNYNSTIAKLILSSNHGMRESKSLEHSGVDGWPIKTENTNANIDVNEIDEQKADEILQDMLLNDKEKK